MLTQEDLRAISGIFKEGIKGVEDRLDRVDGRLDNLESDVNILKSDVKILKSDVKTLQSDANKLKSDVKIIRVDILENNALPRLSTIEQCYLDTSRRYTERAEKFDAAIADIEVMKLAIQKNSADIRELQLKQA